MPHERRFIYLMRILGLTIGLLMICVGVIGVVAPGYYVTGGEYMLTTNRLYIIAAIRITMGVVLLLAASASRLPTTIRVFGVIALVSGVSTPFIGVERARAVFSWASSFGSGVLRLWGVVALLIGVVISFAFFRPSAKTIN